MEDDWHFTREAIHPDNLIVRHSALLERVTVLERALERTRDVVDDDWGFREARTGMHPRAEMREIIGLALDGEGYRDHDHHDKARDEQAEGLTDG